MTRTHMTPRDIRTVQRVTACTAAPEGGAQRQNWHWVWGYAFLVGLVASPLVAQSDHLPSGQSATLSEVLEDAVGGEDWLRFRFVAPQIARDGGTVTYETAQADLSHLCDAVARPYMVEYDLRPDVVVISMMDRPVTFGSNDAEATQFFEAFRITDDMCVLDTF